MNDAASRHRLPVAFVTLYLVWGASYLFIRFAVDSIPPLPLSAARFSLAGLILFVAAWAVRRPTLTRAQWRAAALVGTALICSNAAVGYAIQRIPSGVAALLVAMTPCWMVLLEWWQDRRRRPAPGVVAGLLLGLVGIGVLIEPGDLIGGGRVDALGALAVLAGTVTWACGSLYARTAPRAADVFVSSGMQMLAGGVVLLAFTLVSGAWADVTPGAVTARSWVGFWYLVLVASLGGFTAYAYVLRHATAARASTYAYVNPVIAVALGAVYAGEPLSPRIMVAAATIVGAVALIVSAGAPKPAPAAHDESVSG
jgi:drug/metabolite transporter (DMT)-like permease